MRWPPAHRASAAVGNESLPPLAVGELLTHAVDTGEFYAGRKLAQWNKCTSSWLALDTANEGEEYASDVSQHPDREKTGNFE